MLMRWRQQPAMKHTSVRCHIFTYCPFYSPTPRTNQWQIVPLIPLILCCEVRLAQSPIKYWRGVVRTWGKVGGGAWQEQFAWGSIVLMEPLTWDCFGNWGQGWEQGSGCVGISEQSHFFLFFEVSCGLDSPSEREAFICLLYDDRQKTLLHTELKCSYFVNGALPGLYFRSSMNSETFSWVILNYYYQQIPVDINLHIISDAIVIKWVTTLYPS